MTPLEYWNHNESYKTVLSKLTKPIRIFMDVDGVILPFAKTLKDTEVFSGAGQVTTLTSVIYQGDVYEETGKVWWDAEVIEMVAELSRHPMVDFIWLTSWRANAPYALDPLLKIQSVGFLPWSAKMTDYSQSFKGVALQELFEASPAKFVWVDDLANIKSYDESHYFAPYESEGDVIVPSYLQIIPDSDELEPTPVIKEEDYLVVTPNKYVGLTVDDVEKIIAWVEENTSA